MNKLKAIGIENTDIKIHLENTLYYWKEIDYDMLPPMWRANDWRNM